MKKPVLIEHDAPAPLDPGAAPPIPDEPVEGRAMVRAVAVASRRGSALGRFALTALLALVTFIASVMAWRFVDGLLASSPVLGLIAALLIAAFVLALVLLAIREMSAYLRLARIDRLSRSVDAVIATGDLQAGRGTVAALERLYAGREDTAWGIARLKEQGPDILDADTLLAMAERELMGPLDLAARAEIQASARQVAAVTAIVPLALADVAAALFANLRMIRRIAEIYGGRTGAFGGWRLLRRVMGHLVATGAVAVGDDMIQSVAGGGLLSKLSRRFGEGVINGALTARVGVAAMELCRPMPFRALPKPRVTNLVTRGLAGLFGGGGSEKS
ncbi:YcjF family protein [Defluviimonas sp. WL0002]|uniref:YcjF family protein n=1 Tax=Albidovulum marisflavi TaxID=2984159 RepID=A0ABT2Z9X4_9RHOB|nr:YcjF family protein [Defluviimonas sp. WL0002]MCV2867934.1 YcjF family protein [Defluviimonas sp. WL0002]